MKTFMTAVIYDSLSFIMPFLFGASVFALFGGIGLMAGVVSIMLLDYIIFIWGSKKKDIKSKKGGK